VPNERFDFSRLGFVVAGIYGGWFVFGYFQEKVAVTEYEGQRFTFVPLLMLAQCAVSTAVGALALVLTGASPTRIPTVRYLKVSVPCLSAMLCTNKALHYVPFPLQVIAKSGKMVPVMAYGRFVQKKQYSPMEYLCAILVTAGVVGFAMFKNKGAGTEVAFDASLMTGLLLLGMALLCDAMTPNMQEAINQDAKKLALELGEEPPSSFHLMTLSNMFSTGWSLAVLALSGQMADAINFCVEHPAVLKDIAFFALSSSIGQIFIYQSQYYFGGLTTTTIGVTRKFFTMLISIVAYGHVISLAQWVCALCVFGGVTIAGIDKHRRNSKIEQGHKGIERQELKLE